MRYIPHTDDDIRQMLEIIGVESVENLFDCVPEALRLHRQLDIPGETCEQDIFDELSRLASQNANTKDCDWFLGAGVYAHYIPSAIAALTSRAEFSTAYTPYQPELSQGTLQAVFEWQTMMCGLTGCDVSNASMYDGASSCAEAALMAMRITKRSKVAVSERLHPHYRQVLDSYLNGLRAEVVTIPGDRNGCTSFIDSLDEKTACVILQQPNFFGCVENIEAASQVAHKVGALLLVSIAEALSLALLEPPAELGADIVCGEAQSFGVSTSFGGPHIGFLATGSKFVRQLPGRIVGETVDSRGKRGFVLTLSTREQHIRRERATSNICTNQGLCLLMATIYLALHGPKALAELARINFSKAQYARGRIEDSKKLSLPFCAPGFNEFVVGLSEPAEVVLRRARAEGIIAGLDLTPYYPELGPSILACVTELSSRNSIDRWIGLLEDDRA